VKAIFIPSNCISEYCDFITKKKSSILMDLNNRLLHSIIKMRMVGRALFEGKEQSQAGRQV
jgi:hypothetical protein